MPTIISQEEVKIEWTDIAGKHSVGTTVSPARSSGVHLSGVIRYLAVTSGVLKNIDPTTGKWTGDGTPDDEEVFPLRMALGMAWEDWIVGLYPEMIHQPGEQELNGIFGSPDGVTMADDGGLIVEEFKCTWKSSRKPITDQWMWIQQGSGYCNMLGTDLCRFNVLYVNGDYRPSAPQFMRYLLKYSSVELQRNWSMILKSKDKAKAEI